MKKLTILLIISFMLLVLVVNCSAKDYGCSGFKLKDNVEQAKKNAEEKYGKYKWSTRGADVNHIVEQHREVDPELYDWLNEERKFGAAWSYDSYLEKVELVKDDVVTKVIYSTLTNEIVSLTWYVEGVTTITKEYLHETLVGFYGKEKKTLETGSIMWKQGDHRIYLYNKNVYYVDMESLEKHIKLMVKENEKIYKK